MMPSRADCLRAAYESAQDRLPPGAGLPAFERSLAAWEVIPVQVDGQLVGAILRSGPELHACVRPQGFGRWLGRRHLRLVQDAIDRHGCCTTSVMAGNRTGMEFVSRLGFVRTGEQGGVIFYRKGGNHGY